MRDLICAVFQLFLKSPYFLIFLSSGGGSQLDPDGPERLQRSLRQNQAHPGRGQLSQEEDQDNQGQPQPHVE